MTARVWLLDANLLIALTHAAHVHHDEAHAWFLQSPRRSFATCALTQLAFIRLSCNPKIAAGTVVPAQAMRALAGLAAHPRHVYWPDSPEPLGLAALSSPALIGHRQVTDAYLLGLAAQRQDVLATLDRGLVSYAQALGLQQNVELAAAAAPAPRQR